AAATPAAAVTSPPFPSRAATAAVSDETAWPRDRNETAPNPASFPPAAQSVAAAQSADTAEETVVWLPKNGKRYHAIPTCSGMNSTRGVSVAEAVLAGYTPCPQCKPPGE
ncbi:MAG: hypothetical protein FWG37_06490, partial [Clostridia bacterium]|nr:hypothetical protein [Clostridia bacterium]